MPSKFTTHLECDVPDEKLGAAMRLLMQVKAENISQRPNGLTKVRSNETAGKVHGASMRDVIIKLMQKHGRMTKSAIMSEVEKAGFAPTGCNSHLMQLVNSKVINRVERGQYAMLKALPAPKKAH